MGGLHLTNVVSTVPSTQFAQSARFDEPSMHRRLRTRHGDPSRRASSLLERAKRFNLSVDDLRENGLDALRRPPHDLAPLEEHRSFLGTLSRHVLSVSSEGPRRLRPKGTFSIRRGLPAGVEDEWLTVWCISIPVDGAGVKVMLITTRRKRRWSVPKGNPIRKEKPHRTAAIEAYD
jgi:hypothetical protein